MTRSHEAVYEACEAANRALVAGRDVILAGPPLAGATRWVESLRDLGAARLFVLAIATGTGPLPSADDAQWHVLGLESDDVVSEIRATKAILADLPGDARAALDVFDPARAALVLVPSFLEAGDLDGRPFYGARPESWAALEDKTRCDALLEAAGVRVAPHEIVAPAPDALGRAAGRLDAGLGTVWSGDTRDGFNGGGSHVRWVRGHEHAERALQFFADHCDAVRVTPFLDGVPCSIHGFVADDGVAVFRPVEMVVMRRPPDHPDADCFVYAGCATFWDPPVATRDEMRDTARRTGAELAARAGFRGAFTVDGVATPDGFAPTEINARFGAALGYASVVAPRLGIALLHQRAVSGEPLEIGAAELEAVVTIRGDATRWGHGIAWVGTRIDTTTTEERAGLGTLMVGPATTGGLVRIEPDAAQVPVGPSIAPLVAEAFAHTDATYGTGIGPVVPATGADTSG